MKYFNKPASCALAAGLLLGMISCGGSDLVAGIEGTGDTVSAGTVSAFGSIYVNGVRFDTSSAAIDLNGDSFSGENELKLGMVVRVEGSMEAGATTGVADRVIYDRALKGTIDAVVAAQPSRKTLSVLGQTVVAHADIAYDGVTFDNLKEGMAVEISGLHDGAGSLIATRVELVVGGRPDEPAFDVEGRIGEHDSVNQTFTLGELTIDYAAAAIADGLESDLVAGRWIEVQGDQLDAEGALLAQRVHIGSTEFFAPANVLVQVEGVVEDFTSLSSFSVNGVAVDAGNASIHRGSVNQLANGVHIAIEGVTIAEDRVRADKLTFMLPSESRIVGSVEDINTTTGELTVLGIGFQSDRTTAYEDRSAAANRFIHLRRISVGDVVEVFSRRIGDRYTATRIKRLNDQDGEVTLEGSVTSVASNSMFRVMNILVSASGAEGAELVAGMQPGDIVKVKGALSGTGTVTAFSVTVMGASCSAGTDCSTTPIRSENRPD